MAKKKKKSNIKIYVLVFFASLLCTIIVFGTTTNFYIKHKEKKYQEEFEEAEKLRAKQAAEDEKIAKEKAQKELEERIKKIDLNSLESLIENSKRINVLLLGTDGGRADTIILASFDPDRHLLDFITVPRDTYHEVPGYNYPGQKKINSVFGYGEQDGGGRGMKAQVSQILGAPIHYYILADYEAISSVVEAIGGVEVEIEKAMNYDDIKCKPPLHIHFEPGKYNLTGQQAIEYLRWRKNNGTNGEGDLPRTKRQIEFIKTAIKKILKSGKYKQAIKACYDYVSTDMPVSEILFYSTGLIDFNPSTDIETHVLPGKPFLNVLSYYGHDEEETEKMVMKVYKKGVEEEKKRLEEKLKKEKLKNETEETDNALKKKGKRN